MASVGDGHGDGHGNGHGVGAADAGTEWGSLFGAGGTGSPPPAGSESPEFGYASPDTSGFGSGGSDSDSDSGSDAGSESDPDAEDGAAGARRSVSVPRDRVLSPARTDPPRLGGTSSTMTRRTDRWNATIPRCVGTSGTGT